MKKRDNEIKQEWYRLGLGYCSRTFSVFDLGFGWCGNIEYSEDKQKAAFANNLFSGMDSEIQSNAMAIGLSLRIGEDFFK